MNKVKTYYKYILNRRIYHEKPEQRDRHPVCASEGLSQ